MATRDGDGEIYLLTKISKSNLLLFLKKTVSLSFASHVHRKSVVFLKYAIKPPRKYLKISIVIAVAVA